MSRRFLFTGSQGWTDYRLLANVILHHMKPGDTLVQGMAVGLDELARTMWKPFGPVEDHPCWDFPTPLARNIYLVELGAVECHAFALKWGSGTGHCARQARLACIPTFDHGVNTCLNASPYAAKGRR